MKVTRDVIHDLLPAYLAGEASADTAALIDEFLRKDPELAATVESLRSPPLPETPIRWLPTHEKEAFNMTRRLLRWQSTLMGVALFLTLFPLSFRFDSRGITWQFFRDAPPAATALVAVAALVCWCSFLYVRGRLRGTGL